MASRATRNAASSRKPRRTSCTTGRHVTTSSRPPMSSKVRRGGLRKTSIQAEVSTRSTGHLPPGLLGNVASHGGEVTVPQPRTGEREQLPRPGAADEFRQRQIDGPRIGALPRQPGGFLKDMLIEHKICTFHVYYVTRWHGRGQSEP